MPTTAAVRLGETALTVLYRLCEKRLLSDVRRYPVPLHVGLILDGNRRYGRQHNLTDPRNIYAAGAEKLDDLLSWCADLAIPAITLWVFSTDNFDRRPEDVSGILSVVEAKLTMLARDPRIHQRKVRARAVGRLELLPKSTLAAVRAAETGSWDRPWRRRSERLRTPDSSLSTTARQGLMASDRA